MRVQWLALSQQEGPSFGPRVDQGCLSVWSLHVLPMPAWVPTPVQRHGVRSTSSSGLPLSVDGCVAMDCDAPCPGCTLPCVQSQLGSGLQLHHDSQWRKRLTGFIFGNNHFCFWEYAVCVWPFLKQTFSFFFILTFLFAFVLLHIAWVLYWIYNPVTVLFIYFLFIVILCKVTLGVWKCDEWTEQKNQIIQYTKSVAAPAQPLKFVSANMYP